MNFTPSATFARYPKPRSFCTFFDNTAGSLSLGGGTIANVIGTLTVSQLNFYDNTAESAGAILNFALITVSGSVLTVSDSTFAGNTANTGAGGAIRNHSFGTQKATTTITESTIVDNVATGDGGVSNSTGVLLRRAPQRSSTALSSGTRPSAVATTSITREVPAPSFL